MGPLGWNNLAGMGKPINIQDAKAQLSKLVSRAEAGEEIIIARAGMPVARLAPLDKAAKPAPQASFGKWRGMIREADDFDAPLPYNLLALFHGGQPDTKQDK